MVSTQLLKVLDKWTDALDQGGVVGAVYLDLAKGFHMVPHRRLLVKLSAYGIQGKLLEWIEEFIKFWKEAKSWCGRKFFVME